MMEIHEQIGRPFRPNDANAEQAILQKPERLHQLRLQRRKLRLRHLFNRLCVRFFVVAILPRIALFVHRDTHLDERMRRHRRFDRTAQTFRFDRRIEL